jgi:FAD/FMN-containing dehydrogenase
MRGNHALAGAPSGKYESRRWTFPFVPPVSIVNALTLRPFNTIYYYQQFRKGRQRTRHYEPFFYPLDGILEWNRIYGPRGFYQYQCVIPHETGKEALRTLLEEVADSGMGSILAVLKICGARSSPGILSFPRPGVSLALDFPNRGATLHRLFDRLDHVVDEAGGRLYPAKDGCMPGALFRKGYPRWQEFLEYRDPHFESSFWRRVTEGV